MLIRDKDTKQLINININTYSHNISDVYKYVIYLKFKQSIKEDLFEELHSILN
jgi:hypothetical protein